MSDPNLAAMKAALTNLIAAETAKAAYKPTTKAATVKANALKTSTAAAALKTAYMAFEASLQPAPTPQPTPAPANSVTVGNTSALNAALKVATAGQTILLAPGQYDGLDASGLTLIGVTLTPLDPANPAVLTGFYMTGTSGLTVANLVFSTQGSSDAFPFRFYGGKDLTFLNLSVQGDLAGDPQAQMTGLAFNGCDQITVKGCEFQKLLNGVSAIASTNVLITGNRLHDIGTDGIDVSGCSDATLSDNWISDIYPAAGQHPDGSQFSDPSATVSPKNIAYLRNLYERGAGGSAQGITIGDEAGLGIEGVTIDENVIIGGNYNGISVADGINVRITNNHVLPFADQESWIGTRGCSAPVVITGNTGTKIAADATVDISGNTIIPGPPADKGAAAIAAWHVAHAGAVYGVRL